MIAQSDVLIVVLNIDEKRIENLDEVVTLAAESKKPWIMLINKTDLPELHRPQILRERYEKHGVPVVQGSARDGAASLRETVLNVLKPLLPASPARSTTKSSTP